MFEYCQNCLRKLTDPTSRRNGFGPECREQLGYQQSFIDAGRTAVRTGALDDSKLIVLGRILQRTENNLLHFRESDLVPLSVVRTLRQVRHDYEMRARYLQRAGLLHVPEPEIQLDQVAA